MITFDELVDQLTVRQGAGQRSGLSMMFVCPFHDDVNPSLAIRPGDDGEALAFCHGCIDGAVYPRLVEWLRDGAVPVGASKAKGSQSAFSSSSAPLGLVVAQYRYHDVNGLPVALKLRYEPKEFRWKTWRSGGFSVWGLSADPPCLYRINEIAERAKEIGEVIVVEGEKDADRLWELGYAATCTPWGARPVSKGVVEFIAGLGVPVRVIRDKDDKGHAWAAGLHRVLIAAGVSTSVWETPLDFKGADVSDHLDDGLDLDDELVAVPLGLPASERAGGSGASTSPRGRETASPADVRIPRPVPDEVLWKAKLSTLCRRITEGTEIDPVGVLAEALCGLGTFIGPNPYVPVASDRHPVLVWALLVGHTTVGRKGQADAAAKTLLRAVDAEFVSANRVTGLSSGEGLIQRVRDGEPENPNDTPERAERRDKGVTDKRLWVVESEWATAMIRAAREGSTLGPVMRSAWAGEDLGLLNRDAIRASRPHIGIVGHITPTEFVTRMHNVELSGGTYNRFLPVFVERSQVVPEPPAMDASMFKTEAFELRRACAAARQVGVVSRAEDFRELWRYVYQDLTTDDENTTLSRFTARAAPQALRVAAVLALTEERSVMTADDLDCALAFVNYSIASARYVIGASTEQAVVERFQAAIQAAAGKWVSRDHVYREEFQRNVKRSVLDAAWLIISADSSYEAKQDQTDGRPRTSYRYTPNGVTS